MSDYMDRKNPTIPLLPLVDHAVRHLPADSLISAPICRQLGYENTPVCTTTKMLLLPVPTYVAVDTCVEWEDFAVLWRDITFFT